jgi:hypothetical protein
MEFVDVLKIRIYVEAKSGLNARAKFLPSFE